MKKRFFALFLTAAMLMSLTACAETPPPATTAPPPSTTAPPTTQSGLDAAELYNSAAEKIRSAPSMLIDYTIEKEMTVGTDLYLETQKTNLSMCGIGSDAFSAKGTTAYTWGEDYYADASDVYSGGTLYGTMDYTKYSAELSPEDFQARYLPGVLLTAELYETVEMLDDGTISFSGATALEPWLSREGFELVEASGTASIDASGELQDCTYQASYTHYGVEFRLNVTSRTMTGTITVEAPADTDAYISLGDANAPLIFERSVGLVLQACDITSVSSETVAVQAGAALLTQQCTMNCFGSGTDLMGQFDTDVSLTDLSTGGNVYSVVQNELFRDGVYTISTDGGAAEPDDSVDTATMRSACQAFIFDMLPYLEDLSTLTLSDEGAALLMEYTLSEEAAENYTTWLCGAIYEDPELLNTLASDYRTDTAAGYIGIDHVTGLPLSMGMEFMGVHTIDGTEYLLAYDHSQYISIGTGEAYREITGQSLPLEEPEVKATPLFYHVTGENGEEMWLFGTIHVGDARTSHLPQTILDAFAASDALAVEFDTDAFTEQMEADPEFAAQISQYYIYSDGTTITDHLEDDTLADRAVRILKSTGNYNSAVLMMRPMILAQSIENDYLRLSRTLTSDQGMDSQLLAMAREQNKQILNVESGESQIQMLTGYSDALQELLLAETLMYTPDEYAADVSELYELWCAGDEVALREVINEEAPEMTEQEAALYEEYNNAMSSDRNVDMLEVAKGYLSGEQTVFYAVGLAHLLAEDGLVNTLRDAGYTVELVPCA